jgi:hypothetical protein
VQRFFFHVVNDESATIDEEGTELPDLDAAFRETRKILGAILADEMSGAVNLLHLSIMIADAQGHRVGNIKSVTQITTTIGPSAE